MPGGEFAAATAQVLGERLPGGQCARAGGGLARAVRRASAGSRSRRGSARRSPQLSLLSARRLGRAPRGWRWRGRGPS